MGIVCGGGDINAYHDGLSNFFCCSLFTNLRITYLIHILIVGRIQTLCFRLHCHSIHQNLKIGSEKVQHGAHLTEGGQGVKSYLDNAQIQGLLFIKGLP